MATKQHRHVPESLNFANDQGKVNQVQPAK